MKYLKQLKILFIISCFCCCSLKKLKLNSNSNNKTCYQCKKNGNKNLIKKCKRCREVYYCSKKCQKIDWKSKHRNDCKPNFKILKNSRSVFNIRIPEKEKIKKLGMISYNKMPSLKSNLLQIIKSFSKNFKIDDDEVIKLIWVCKRKSV
ncbi:MAG: zinc finger MYND domain-containing protein [Bacteroidetes bacterium]|nr:zinc finger MYND domain-containing protein [Bacteroidota bacterium]